MFITVFILKGGETKSTTAANLAAALALKGFKGTVVDANPTQGTIMQYAGSIPGVTFTRTVPTVRAEGEFVVVDAAPSLTTQIANALKQSDVVVIPITATPEAAKELNKTFEALQEVMEHGGDFYGRVVYTRFERSHELAVNMQRYLSRWPLANVVIPKRTRDFGNAFDKGVPVVLAFPKSAGATAYKKLLEEIYELVNHAEHS